MNIILIGVQESLEHSYTLIIQRPSTERIQHSHHIHTGTPQWCYREAGNADVTLQRLPGGYTLNMIQHLSSNSPPAHSALTHTHKAPATI